jgi:hypothetical protein
MLDLKTGQRKLDDEVVAEGRRRRGELKNPGEASILATLRSAHSHLEGAHRSARGHVQEMFGLPRPDAIADAARGFNGQ